VINTSLNYVSTPNSYPFKQKELLGAQEEGQTRSFPSSTGQPGMLGHSSKEDT
jgi:hypothetical protein